MAENLCGLCEANGLKKQLILFQLNLEEAILLCENKEVSSSSVRFVNFLGLLLNCTCSYVSVV